MLVTKDIIEVDMLRYPFTHCLNCDVYDFCDRHDFF